MDRNKTAVPAQKRIDIVFGSVYEDNIAIVQQNSCVLVARANVPALVNALIEAVGIAQTPEAEHEPQAYD